MGGDFPVLRGDHACGQAGTSLNERDLSDVEWREASAFLFVSPYCLSDSLSSEYLIDAAPIGGRPSGWTMNHRQRIGSLTSTPAEAWDGVSL